MEQVNIFELLDGYEQPTVAPEDLQDGDKLWTPIIEGLYTNSLNDRAPIVEVAGRACRIQVKKQGQGHWWWQEIDHKGYSGGTVLPKPLFRRKPSDRDIMHYIRERAPRNVWTGQLTPETVWTVIDVDTMRATSLKDD